MRSRNWPHIERLPETDGAVIMTSTGYARDGHHTRTVPKLTAPPKPRQSFWQRITEKSN